MVGLLGGRSAGAVPASHPLYEWPRPGSTPGVDRPGIFLRPLLRRGSGDALTSQLEPSAEAPERRARTAAKASSAASEAHGGGAPRAVSPAPGPSALPAVSAASALPAASAVLAPRLPQPRPPGPELPLPRPSGEYGPAHVRRPLRGDTTSGMRGGRAPAPRAAVVPLPALATGGVGGGGGQVRNRSGRERGRSPAAPEGRARRRRRALRDSARGARAIGVRRTAGERPRVRGRPPKSLRRCGWRRRTAGA